MNRLQVIRSFDRIAECSTESWDHNNYYHPYLVRNLPQRRGSALEIGSGLGQFSRALAGYFEYVEGIDFCPKMVEGAIARSTSIQNLRYRCEDFLEIEYPINSFDCIVSVATIHHLPVRQTFEKIIRILKPGGRLLILDLYKSRQLLDYVFSAVGIVANIAIGANRRDGKNIELRKAWAEHAPLDNLPTIKEIWNASQEFLPEAIVRRHIFFRYSLLWDKK
jgi:SAM-dependent methyltransferase